MSEKNKIIFARVLGYIIDILFLNILLLVISNFVIFSEIIWDILKEVAIVFYFIFLHFRYGKTLGKSIFNIKVFQFKSHNKITIFQAFKRESIWILFSAIAILPGYFQVLDLIILGFNWNTSLFYLLSLILLISTVIDKDNRGIHDRIANTYVGRDVLPDSSEMK